ncbi:MAG: 2-amino-4-hydroxy-6-hydroxymethyldihydropteridine diphosphokinase [Candidatus Dadabacteria bacterium]|nr:MAG: 2-amino-4-hydroxy-6-hydroxymethyldihydropteridine diphosphokinase [Candidatus Dadabacteria bacterium]
MCSAGLTRASTDRRATVWLAIGLNVPPHGWRWQRLIRALDGLPRTRLCEVSPVLRNPAHGPGVTGRFWNACARIETDLAPIRLLDRVKRIERRLGRRHPGGNRPADIDLICWRESWGWRTLKYRRLTLPHPRARDRPFVMIPLARLEQPPSQLVPTASGNRHQL